MTGHYIKDCPNRKAATANQKKQYAHPQMQVASVELYKPKEKVIDENVYAIQGKMMFNKVEVSYLCDPGAAITVISRKVFNRINTLEHPVHLRPKVGGPVTSCKRKIKFSRL
mgnify:CR=1 FL=1